MSKTPHPSKWFCPSCRPARSITRPTPCPRCCGFAPPIRRPDDLVGQRLDLLLDGNTYVQLPGAE